MTKVIFSEHGRIFRKNFEGYPTIKQIVAHVGNKIASYSFEKTKSKKLDFVKDEFSKTGYKVK